MKTCKKCGEAKSLDSFNKDRSKPDGLQIYCRPCRKGVQAKHREANRDAVNENQKTWRRNNREASRRHQLKYMKKRYAEDPAFCLKTRLRSRLCRVLRGRPKDSTTQKLVGCTWDELRAHIESQFVEGMSWDNRAEWHIDHIRPIASFEDPADPACWHYTNLQPLWAEDNKRKAARLPDLM